MTHDTLDQYYHVTQLLSAGATVHNTLLIIIGKGTIDVAMCQ